MDMASFDMYPVLLYMSSLHLVSVDFDTTLQKMWLCVHIFVCIGHKFLCVHCFALLYVGSVLKVRHSNCTLSPSLTGTPMVLDQCSGMRDSVC